MTADWLLVAVRQLWLCDVSIVLASTCFMSLSLSVCHCLYISTDATCRLKAVLSGETEASQPVSTCHNAIMIHSRELCGNTAVLAMTVAGLPRK